jgi:hypothetical protein
MAEKSSWLNITPTQRSELAPIKAPGWQLVPGRDLPSLFSPSLRAKIDSAVLIAAQTSTGGTYLAYSANRVDGEDIDVQPFGLIYHSTGPGQYGVFIHHGNWKERTTPVPAGFTEYVSRSGIGGYFMTRPPDGLLSGALDQLPPGHPGAFQAVINQLRAREDSKA